MTSRMLLQFIEKTGIPFVTTQLGKGVIDESHPKFLGCAALSAGDFCHRAIDRPTDHRQRRPRRDREAAVLHAAAAAPR